MSVCECKCKCVLCVCVCFVFMLSCLSSCAEQKSDEKRALERRGAGEGEPSEAGKVLVAKKGVRRGYKEEAGIGERKNRRPFFPED